MSTFAGLRIIPSWYVERDQLVTVDGAFFVHPLMMVQLEAVDASLDDRRPDVDVWLDGMVRVVGELAAIREAQYLARMQVAACAEALGTLAEWAAPVIDAQVSLAATVAAEFERMQAAMASGRPFDFLPRVRRRDRLRWWLEEQVDAVLDLVRAIVYRLGARPRGGVLHSPSREAMLWAADFGRHVADGARVAEQRADEIHSANLIGYVEVVDDDDD